MKPVYWVVHVDHAGMYIDELHETYNQWLSPVYGKFQIDTFLNGARFDHLPMWRTLGIFVCDCYDQRWI